MDEKLYFAAVNGEVHVIRIYRDSLSSQLTATRNTVLHLYVGVPPRKTGNDDDRFISTVLDYQESLLVEKNDNGEIPLHLAARFGHTNAVEVFINRATRMGADCLREMLMTTDRKKDTALHHAARWNNAQIVELLVKAYRDCPYARNVDGQTPLYLAAERKYSNVVAAMLEDCQSPAYEGPHGRTALHVAVLWEDEGMVRRILGKNNALVRSQDDEGQTPLHYAAGLKRTTKDSSQSLKILLEYDDRSHDSLVYIQDNEGRTALHLAALYGDVHRVKVLIEYRPDCSEIRDKKGMNLFHLAAKSGCRRTIDYLMKSGIFRKLLNEQDREGITPIHLLISSFRFGSLSYGQCLGAFIKEDGIKKMIINSQNQTAGDIMHSQLPYNSNSVFRSIYQLAPRDVPTPEPDESQHVGYVLEKNKMTLMQRDKKNSEVHLVVATLIATVSFAAGIAVPGGFNQDPGLGQGTALLTRQTAFRAFMVSNALSLTLSATAILLYFVKVTMENAREVQMYYTVSVVSTSLSIGTMMVAFMTGTYAIVYQSPSLAAMILVFPALFMFLHVIVLLFTTTGIYRIGNSSGL